MEKRPDHESLIRTLEEQAVPKRVIEAFRVVFREDFVPPEERGRAYLDEPVPIPRDQVTTQPSLIARMIGALDLEGAGRGNATLRVGDGTLGWPEQAPFDVIISSAAAPAAPPPLAAQLREGGRLVQPIGPGGSERVILIREERRNASRALRADAGLLRAHGGPSWLRRLGGGRPSIFA